MDGKFKVPISPTGLSGQRLLNEILKRGPFSLWDHAVSLCYCGSTAHGTYTPNSEPNSIDDKDLMGILIPPKSIFFGMKSFEQFECQEGEWDIVIYDFRKFVRLLTKSNPNILGHLWTPGRHFLIQTPALTQLQENRHLFATKNVYASFCGYSQGQLQKMESMAYKGYMGEKRKALVDKYGYDTKNAQHLIRLLRQGIEFLKTGELIVERPDRAELIQIKRGEWSIEKVKRKASDLFKEMEEANANSKLPEHPDTEKIDLLVQDILQDAYIK